jgi:hypothetical protein
LLKYDVVEDSGQLASELSGDFGKFQEGRGYRYFVPGEELLKRLNADYARHIGQAKLDLAPFWNKCRANQRAYEAIQDAKDAILPIIKRDVNQIIAWGVNTSLRPKPLVSLDPYFEGEHEVLIDDPVYGQIALPKSIEEIAANGEVALDYFLREHLGVEELFTLTWTEMISGKGVLWKVVDDAHKRTTMGAAYGKTENPLNHPAARSYKGKNRRKRPDPCSTKIKPVSIFNFLIPKGYDDVQEAPWVGHIVPSSNLEVEKILRTCVGTKERSEEEITRILAGLTAEASSSVVGAIRPNHELIEVWFTMAVPRKRGEKKKDGVRWEEVEFVGWFHTESQEFLAIWENPYDHYERPFSVFFQRKRPFEFDSGSTTEDLAPIQRMAADLLTIAIENAVLANQVTALVNPESDAMEWFASGMPLESGTTIPARKDDVIPLNFGRELRSLMPEIDWAVGQGRVTSNVSQYEDGSYVPGRTSPNTVSQILQSGAQQNIMILRAFGGAASTAFKFWLRTFRQYNPYGAIVPVKDPETRAIMNVAFRFPVDEDILDSLRVALTAADEAIAKESEVDTLIMISQLLDQDAQIMAQILGPLMDPTVPEGYAQALDRFVTRKQKLLQSVMEFYRVDARKLVLDREILTTISQEREKVKQQMEAQQNAESGLAAPGGAPQGGGALPPAEPYMDGGAGAGAPPESGLPDMAAAPPAEGMDPAMLPALLQG